MRLEDKNPQMPNQTPCIFSEHSVFFPHYSHQNHSPWPDSDSDVQVAALATS